jgi:hypothetical protein
MRRIITLLIFTIGVVAWAGAQTNFGKIKGRVVNKKTKQPMAYVEVTLLMDGAPRGGALTDDFGNYFIKAVDPGEDYTLRFNFVGYKTYTLTGVSVDANATTTQNVEMSEDDGTDVKGVVVRAGRPLVEAGKNSQKFSNKDLKKLPTRSLAGMSNAVGGVNNNGGAISFSGQRTDGTAVFIDGVRVIGSSSLTQVGTENVEFIQSGVPAMFGDFTGGAINVTTTGASGFHRKSLEIITSSLFDDYHFNQVEASVGGPLKIKNKGGGDEEYVSLAYLLAGNVRYFQDPSPPYGGFPVVRDDKLAEIEQNPLTLNPQGFGLVPTSSFLTEADLVYEDARRNVPLLATALQGKIEFQPNKDSRFTFFGSHNYSNSRNFSYSQYLMNYKENSLTTNHTFRTYVKFTQSLLSTKDKDDDESVPLIADILYSIRLDYQTSINERSNPELGDNFFQYGYLGRFENYKRPAYTYEDETEFHVDQDGDTVRRRGFWEYAGYQTDSIRFRQADINQFRGNYTRNAFEFADDIDFNIRSEDVVTQLGGLLNGFNTDPTYSLWYNPGTVAFFYEKNQSERITAFALGEASLNLGDGENKHDLQFGLTYEQTISSRWAIGATQLWTLMPQLVNRHLGNFGEVDKFTVGTIEQNGEIYDLYAGGIHSYDENGRFMDTITYQAKVDPSVQTGFDKRLRQRLIDQGWTDVNGQKVDELYPIDINALDPSVLTLDLFDADDLWNNGNTYIAYYGYDYLGNRQRTRKPFTDFFNNTKTRDVNSFAPIYAALFLQDKFEFKDLTFRLGLRIERYDANQDVLKDPYSLYPVQTVSEVKTFNDGAIEVNHPGSVEDDWVVYVNNSENPTKVLGYRDENTWYDENGNQISNPELIAQETVNGRIQPALVDPENQELTGESFEDYEPQINVLPRVWFTFPINKEAKFYANYDVLAQTPLDGATFAPANVFFYLEPTQGGTIPNAALRPRIRTTYEVGFKQQVSDNSAFTIVASYAETRNDFGLIRVNQAYPISYNTYSNIDFATSKQIRFEYEIRGDFSLRANYTLLFADGTGSNVNSQAALIAANLPNLRSLFPTEYDIRHTIGAVLDYRFKGGDKYQGPILFGKKVFQNAGANLLVNAQSGRPYTAALTPTGTVLVGSAQRSQIKGNPFGSRMPWQFKVDANIQKDFTIQKKTFKDDNRHAKEFRFTAYLWIQNLLNSRITQNVYRFTGLPDDDGFLSSPQGQQVIEQQINAQSFVDLYNAKVTNPYNFAIPRLMRLGVRVYF